MEAVPETNAPSRARAGGPGRRSQYRPRRGGRGRFKITIDDFMKVELRVAKVLAAEKVPNSRKLVKLSIDVGHRAADARRRDRRSLRARAARGPDDRHGLQPQARQADGHRVERHGPRGEPRRRQAARSWASIRTSPQERGSDSPPNDRTTGRPAPTDDRATERPKTEVIDSHCHLADEAFAGDLEAVVRRAQDAGLTSALCILRRTTNRSRRRRPACVKCGRPCASRSAFIPTTPASSPIGSAEVRARAVAAPSRRSKAVAIGEIGLDYHYDFSPREVQWQVFAAQVALARSLALPIVVHTREATEDTFRLLRESRRAAWRLPLFHRRRRDGARGAGSRVLRVARRDRHVPEGRGAARRGAVRPERSAARRDGFAVSGARAVSAGNGTSRAVVGRVVEVVAALRCAWSRAVAGRSDDSQLRARSLGRTGTLQTA